MNNDRRESKNVEATCLGKTTPPAPEVFKCFDDLRAFRQSVKARNIGSDPAMVTAMTNKVILDFAPKPIEQPISKWDPMLENFGMTREATYDELEAQFSSQLGLKLNSDK